MLKERCDAMRKLGCSRFGWEAVEVEVEVWCSGSGSAWTGRAIDFCKGKAQRTNLFFQNVLSVGIVVQ